MNIPARYAPILFGALLSAIMVTIVSAFVIAPRRATESGQIARRSSAMHEGRREPARPCTPWTVACLLQRLRHARSSPAPQDTAMTRKPDQEYRASKDDKASPTEGTTTAADGGYAEKHGPRHDKDGWGEANAAQSDRAGTSEDSQGHAAGERSFDHGKLDPASAEAASEASLREPGARGNADAKSPPDGEDESPGMEANDAPLSRDGRQMDYGQGGGQGYIHTGKPGAPDPDK